MNQGSEGSEGVESGSRPSNGADSGHQRLAALFEQTGAGIAEFALNGALTRVNDRFCRLLGRTNDELLGLKMHDITAPEDLTENLSLLDRLFKTGEPFEIEKRYLRPDGTPVWVKNNVSLIRGPDGRAVSVLAVVRDISESRETQEALRETSQRLNAIINNTEMAVFMMDDRQRCVFMNKAAEELTGYAFPEVQGGPLHDFIHNKYPDGRHYPIEECPIDRALPEDDQVQGEELFVHKDGHFYPVAFTASPIRDETGQPIGTVIEAHDISSELEAKQAAEEQSRILETLNRTGSALSGELELQKVVQMVTDAGVELTGAQFGAFFYNVFKREGGSYMLFTLSGAEPSQFDFGMPRATAVFHPTFSGEGPIRSDDITTDPRYGKSGPHFGMPEGHLPVRSYLAVPVISRSGEVLGGLFFGHSEPGRFTDSHERLVLGVASQAAVSIDNAHLYQAVQQANETLEQRVEERSAELERANEALRQAQKMEAIGQLTGGIAHDFNNLLTVIRGSADVLRRPGLTEEKRERYLEAIADTADRAARLTGQLLAFARRQALRPEVFNAAERVESITEMLRTVLGSRIKLQIRSQCDTCFVEADAAQFETAVVNMTVNGRDAMDGEGTLTISIGMSAELPQHLNPAGGAPHVALSVSDTGQGIAPEDLDKIFEPFFTTKEVGKGTGLGLSQVYGFAKQSGGETDVRSELGTGTTFTLYLPQVDRVEAADAAVRGEPLRLKRGGKVLIVEDNDEVGRFAEQVIFDLGFEAERVGNAAEARELLQSEHSFDLIFTDVVMPGIGGIDFAREVRERWPNLPIVLTSGYSHILAGKSGHGFPLLQKPYSLEALERALAQALHR